jgi:NitT/TauT family transport system substrate-binding protein
MAKAGNPAIVNISNVQVEWAQTLVPAGAAAKGFNYPMTALVVSGDFAAKNKKAIDAFLKAAEASIKWTQEHPAEAGVLVEKHNLGLKAAVIEKAIPASNYDYIPATKARPFIEALFKTFLKEDAIAGTNSIGGKLPADSFYYK